ncbi:MAG TPA: hypothetical protein VMV32_11805 [Ignavibacteriaceae bacterium]|nr:hypothetical protein [Ignavibacteriaceae bacterium]
MRIIKNLMALFPLLFFISLTAAAWSMNGSKVVDKETLKMNVIFANSYSSGNVNDIYNNYLTN